MMSGAWPPPAPSVWKAWMVRPLKAAIVSSTKPDSFERVGVDHHLHVVLVGDRQAAVDGGRRRAPVLVQLERAGAGLDHFLERRRAARRCPCRRSRGSSGRRRPPAIMRRDVPRARRAGGREGAVAGPVPPPSMVVTPRHQRLLDLLRADEVDVGVDAAGGEDLALAGDHLGARADDDVDARLDVGIAGLADGGDAAVLAGRRRP